MPHLEVLFAGHFDAYSVLMGYKRKTGSLVRNIFMMKWWPSAPMAGEWMVSHWNRGNIWHPRWYLIVPVHRLPK